MVYVRYTPKGWHWARDFAKTRKRRPSRNRGRYQISSSGRRAPEDRPRRIRKVLTVALTPILWFVLAAIGLVLLEVVIGAPRWILGCSMATWFLFGLVVSAEIADRIVSVRDRSIIRARLLKKRAERKAAAESSGEVDPSESDRRDEARFAPATPRSGSAMESEAILESESWTDPVQDSHPSVQKRRMVYVKPRRTVMHFSLIAMAVVLWVTIAIVLLRSMILGATWDDVFSGPGWTILVVGSVLTALFVDRVRLERVRVLAED